MEFARQRKHFLSADIPLPKRRPKVFCRAIPAFHHSPSGRECPEGKGRTVFLHSLFETARYNHILSGMGEKKSPGFPRLLVT